MAPARARVSGYGTSGGRLKTAAFRALVRNVPFRFRPAPAIRSLSLKAREGSRALGSAPVAVAASEPVSETLVWARSGFALDGPYVGGDPFFVALGIAPYPGFDPRTADASQPPDAPV
jgi:hypothetical protein